MYAMNVARHKMFPDIKKKGLSGHQRLILFTSDQVSYPFVLIGSDEY